MEDESGKDGRLKGKKRRKKKGNEKYIDIMHLQIMKKNLIAYFSRSYLYTF